MANVDGERSSRRGSMTKIYIIAGGTEYFYWPFPAGFSTKEKALKYLKKLKKNKKDNLTISEWTLDPKVSDSVRPKTVYGE